jgi:hypothetical protein
LVQDLRFSDWFKTQDFEVGLEQVGILGWFMICRTFKLVQDSRLTNWFDLGLSD